MRTEAGGQLTGLSPRESRYRRGVERGLVFADRPNPPFVALLLLHPRKTLLEPSRPTAQASPGRLRPEAFLGAS